MKTAIVTDSNSGISDSEGKKLGVRVLPMPVIIEEETYYEGVDLFAGRFYRSLNERKQVHTSQPVPSSVLDMWDRVFEDGYDELVYIPMSGSLSSSCRTAQMLAADYGGRVQVADNRRISVTQRDSVLDALALARSGYTAEEIRKKLEDTAGDSIIYVGVETLDFLKAGGRVTAAAAAMGSVLNIKPLLVIEGGRLDAFARVRGTKNCMRREINVMQKRAEEFHSRGLEIRVGAAGSFLSPEEDRAWFEMVREAFPGEEVHYEPLSFSIGCHVGPGAFGMGISAKLTGV